MKIKRFLFLFFCVGAFSIFNLQGQSSNETLSHYVNLFNKVSSVDSLLIVYKFFKSDKEASLLNNDYQRVVYDLFYMADIEFRIGQYYDSESTAIKAIDLLNSMPESTSNQLTKKSFHNHLGRIKKVFNDYKSSLYYYSKALSLSLSKSDSALILNNIGNLYRYDRKYLRAKKALKKSYNLYQDLGVKNQVFTTCLVNLGFVEGILGNHDQAIELFEEALIIRKRINSPKIFEVYQSLTEYYILKKDKLKAIDYANLSLNAAKKFNSNPYKVKALRDLVDLNQHKYIDRYNQLRDRIDLENRINENKYAIAKYDFEKEKNEKEREKTKRLESEAEAEKSKARSYYYLLLTIIIIGISIFIYFFLISHHKKEKLKQQFRTEQTISKRLHDEVANDLFHLMIKVQHHKIGTKNIVNNLDKIYLKARDISKNFMDIDVSGDFNLILKDFILGYKTDVINILMVNLSEVDWNDVSVEKKKVLYRVLQEFLTNTAKHSEANLVTIKFEKTKQGLSVIYVDNGVGSDLKKGNGLSNVENRIKMIGGKIIFESETGKGFQSTIIL